MNFTKLREIADRIERNPRIFDQLKWRSGGDDLADFENFETLSRGWSAFRRRAATAETDYDLLLEALRELADKLELEEHPWGQR